MVSRTGNVSSEHERDARASVVHPTPHTRQRERHTPPPTTPYFFCRQKKHPPSFLCVGFLSSFCFLFFSRYRVAMCAGDDALPPVPHTPPQKRHNCRDIHTHGVGHLQLGVISDLNLLLATRGGVGNVELHDRGRGRRGSASINPKNTPQKKASRFVFIFLHHARGTPLGCVRAIVRRGRREHDVSHLHGGLRKPKDFRAPA